MNTSDIQFTQDDLNESFLNYVPVIPGLQELLKTEISGTPPYRSFTKIYIEPKNYGNAIDVYTKALENNQDLKIIYYYRGCLRMQIGDNDGAIADFNEYIKIDPDCIEAHYKLALIKGID